MSKTNNNTANTMKTYTAPTVKICRLGVESPLLAFSNETTLRNGGSNSQDNAPTEAEAGGRRNSWGNLWNEE